MNQPIMYISGQSHTFHFILKEEGVKSFVTCSPFLLRGKAVTWHETFEITETNSNNTLYTLA